MNEDNREILRSYPNIWNYKKKIYNIDSIKFIIPIAIEDACFFVASVFILNLIYKILPFIGNLPFVLKWILIPILITKFLTNKKFDGKNPHKYLWGYFKYIISPKKYSRFKPYCIKKEKISFKPVVYRAPLYEDITQNALMTLKRRQKRNAQI